MTNRSRIVLGVLAALAVVSAIGFGLMFMRLGNDSCLDGGDMFGASCPTLAEVNGVRYTISAARGVDVTESDLTPYARIARTNVPDYFSDLQAYSLPGIAPAAALVAPSVSVLDEDDSAYRILWGPAKESSWPALCDYLTTAEKSIRQECSAPA